MQANKVKAVKKAIIKSLEKGAYITAACKAAKISPVTFYEWLRKDKEFAKSVDIAQESRIGIVEDALFKRAEKGNMTAIIFFLCNRAGDRWKSLTKVEHTGNIGFDLMEKLKKLDEEIKKEKNK
jgi:hypothetical protein